MKCLSGRVSEFVETTVFGYPAAPAADWPRARKFSTEMTDFRARKARLSWQLCGQKNQSPFGPRTAEDGWPHTIVSPTSPLGPLRLYNARSQRECTRVN
jgi:hypothetical protein